MQVVLQGPFESADYIRMMNTHGYGLWNRAEREEFMQEKQIINSVAPIRINDLGGWTDTWFAERGTVLNIGVYPYVECQMKVSERRPDREERVIINAENYGDRYRLNPDQVTYDKHPLLEAAVDAMGVPDDREVEVTIYSFVPGGCSTGTSAAVSVALIGALDTLTPGRMTPGEVATAAHEIETVRLKQQCGIQDQLCSAYGGICYIEMHSYPHATVSQLHVPNSVWWELESRLCLIYLGATHSSSAVHQKVIADLEGEGGADSPRIERLRRTAHAGKDAIFDADFSALGKVMIENTEAQIGLHGQLVSQTAHEVIEIARKHGALGWKVNGAGGEGGSLTILSDADSQEKRRMIAAIEEAGEKIVCIPVYLSRYGLRVWESRGGGVRASQGG